MRRESSRRHVNNGPCSELASPAPEAWSHILYAVPDPKFDEGQDLAAAGVDSLYWQPLALADDLFRQSQLVSGQ